MLVFSTRLPLKDTVTQEECLHIFTEWITESPHYPIDNITYDISSYTDFEVTKENITFSIRHIKSEKMELLASRFENREENAVWYNDSIFLCEGGVKSLLIQLNCNRTNYRTQLPRIHKPYIVRKFVESGYCRDDAGIPVCDTPIVMDEKYYDICVKVMRGEYENTMPIVYISCDYMGEYAISSEYLARQLSGVAHVFVEKNREIALKLREDTEGNNVHTGYVGIYFPGTKLCQKHGIEYYRDDREMGSEIINSVWSALINRLDSSVYNWNQIIAIQSRQKMSEWQDISAKDKQQLSEYMDNFDAENESLRQQIAELNKQVYSLHAQLDAFRSSKKEANVESRFYNIGEEPNLYDSERNDLLYSILSQVQSKFDVNSRGYIIIQSLLEANPYVGECSRIMSEVRNVFSGDGKLTSAKKSQLKSAGFSVQEEGPHYKVIFHDERYMFTVSKSPSDHREGKNMISDISKVIDIERKI